LPMKQFFSGMGFAGKSTRKKKRLRRAEFHFQMAAVCFFPKKVPGQKIPSGSGEGWRIVPVEKQGIHSPMPDIGRFFLND